MIQHIRDFGLLRGAALAAATVISFEAEAELAALIGVGETVSYAMPIAIDCLMIAALRSRHAVAIACASVLMGAANATSHLLSHETNEVSQGIVATVSVVPVVVLMLLELLVPAVRETASQAVETIRETVTIQAPPVFPVSWANDETLGFLRDSLTDTGETPDETAEEPRETPPAKPEMSRETAMKVAEDAYAYPGTKTIKEVSEETGYSVAQVNRWRAEFKKSGVKVLAVA